MKILNDILDELKKLNNSNAEIANTQLDLLDKAEMIRINNFNIMKNTDNRDKRIDKYDKTWY